MPVDVVTGSSPLIIALPYTGTNMQRLIKARLRDPDHAITVPDYYVDRLFYGLNDEAGILRCNTHRYLSDVNSESPGGHSTPTQGRIGSVPLLDNTGHRIWTQPPNKIEAANWRSSYYAPFHAALSTQIARVRSVHGYVVLLTCRGLKNQGPFQQADIEADINLATHLGGSCAVDLSAKLTTIAGASDKHTAMMNGSRSAGWITRHYGRPGARIHAVDISVNDACYLTEDFPGHYDDSNAELLRDVLRDMVNFAARWRPT